MKSKRVITALVTLLILVSCKEYAPYETKDVTININVKQCSAGYIEAEYKTDRNAYFYCGIMMLDSGQTKPYTDDQHFMTLMIDSAQIEYRKWRHDLLRDNVPYIASFKDHCLEYGTSNQYYIRLLNNTSYMLYAFAVDIETNEPVGQLFTKVVQTKMRSEVAIKFDYRINGRWDYVYPKDTLGEIMSNHPYNVMTLREDTLRARLERDSTMSLKFPFFYFLNTFIYIKEGRIIEPVNNTLYLGIRSEYHDGSREGIIEFEEGVTYYTGIVSADYIPQNYQISVYKFTWSGPQMKQEFKFEKDALGQFEW